MKDDFKLVISIKKLNDSILDCVKLFPNKEKVVKDNLLSECFDLLKNTYTANNLDLHDNNRLVMQKGLLTNIMMIDYYINYAYRKKYISEKNTKSICNLLAAISKMVKSWINYGKSKS